MSIKYENVVPWGRSYNEYIDMFKLSANDLNKKILGCSDGPASFNSIMNKNGKKIISFDPIYKYTHKQLEKRIADTYNEVIEKTRKDKDKFIWKKIKSVEELGSIRMSAMNEFMSDFEIGKKEGRYLYGELPELPFKDKSFDLVLCAHFLFFYSDNLSLDFHIKSINEMCRVTKEIRIFPLVDLNAKKSKFVKPVKNHLKKTGWKYKEEKVKYQFQKNGNIMLKIVQL